jgi:hypothetical protein
MSNGNEPYNQGPQYILGDDNQGWGSKFGGWLRDNVSILIAVVIIVILAGSIFVYSRNDDLISPSDESDLEVDGEDDASGETLEDEVVEDVVEDVVKDEEAIIVDSEKEDLNITTSDDGNIVSVEDNVPSVIIGDSIREVAAPGEGVTHLARRALASHLSRNPIPGLTKEHKIFIEDYLVKRVGSDFLEVGEARSFSTSMIIDGISEAQSLNQSELNNLTQYANLVPIL